jgi:hypothetical protein
MVNAIFPCLILNLVNLLVFAMPYVNQINICMTIFLTFSVYALKVSSEIPVQSEYLPMVSVYFIVSVVFILLTMCWCVLENHMRAKCYRVPRWLMVDLAGGVRRAVSCLVRGRRRQQIQPSNNQNKEFTENDESEKCEACEPIGCLGCKAKREKDASRKQEKKNIHFYLNQLNCIVFCGALVFVSAATCFIWARLVTHV